MSASNFSDPSLVRGLTQRRFGRRDALRLSGLGAMGAALAACGVQGQGTQAPPSAEPDAVAKFWDGKAKNGSLDFANWPLYMDPKKPEIAAFTKKTGIKVNYQEVIQEMGPWFAKVQPQLSAGQSIGYDLMVITNSFQFTQFRDSGFLAPLDHSKLPSYAKNAGAAYKKEAFDPGNAYSIPWASGMTGIAYDESKTGPIKGLADLWDKRLKGKVGMFSDIQELGNFGLLKAGVDPAKSTEEDWKKAADELKKQKDDGIVRNYYDQSYIERARQRRGVGDPGLVGRHLPEEHLGRDELQVHHPGRGRHDLDRQHDDPDHRQEPGRRDHDDGLLLRGRERRDHRRVHQLRLPGAGRAGGHPHPRRQGER